MRILPNLKWINYKDYKKKVFGKELLAALRGRYKSQVLSGSAIWAFTHMPNKKMKMSIGYNGCWIPKYEWDKLNYRFGKMSKKK